MRCRSLHFVEQTSQMRRNHHAQFCRRAGSHPAGFVERGDQPIKGIVLAKKENLVLATKVVVKIGRREGCSRCNIAHAGFRKPSHAKFPACGAEDFQPASKIAPLYAAIALTVVDSGRQSTSPKARAAKSFERQASSLVSLFQARVSTESEHGFRNRTAVQKASRASRTVLVRKVEELGGGTSGWVIQAAEPASFHLKLYQRARFRDFDGGTQGERVINRLLHAGAHVFGVIAGQDFDLH